VLHASSDAPSDEALSLINTFETTYITFRTKRPLWLSGVTWPGWLNTLSTSSIWCGI